MVSPGQSLESVVEGVGDAVQSSFLIALTVDLGNNVTEGGSTRPPLKSEVVQALRILEQFLEKDTSGQFDTGL